MTSMLHSEIDMILIRYDSVNKLYLLMVLIVLY